VSREKLLLAGIEDLEGTEETLAPATNAMLTSELDITPLEADEIDRNLDREIIGNSAAILVGRRVTLSALVEAAGGGDADTPPPYGTLLRMCGFAETITATTDVSYDLVDDLDTIESATLFAYWRGMLHKMLGARSSLTLNASSRDLARLGISPTGLFVPVTQADPGADADYSAFQAPLEVGNTHSTFSLGGTALEMESLEIDFGHPVNYVHRVGKERVELGNPEPSGTVVIKRPTLATYNFFANAGGDPVALKFVQGTVAGNIFELELDSVQTMQPTYVDLDDAGDGLSIPIRPIGSGMRIITK